jgi:hypothetical protein
MQKSEPLAETGNINCQGFGSQVRPTLELHHRMLFLLHCFADHYTLQQKTSEFVQARSCQQQERDFM